MTDHVPSSPDQNEPRRDTAPRPPQTSPTRQPGPGQPPAPGPPADPGPQPGPYVYSPHTGEQPRVPVQAAPPAGPHPAHANTGGPQAAGAQPAGPHLGGPHLGGPHLGGPHLGGPGPAGPYAPQAYPGGPQAAHVETRDPRAPHPGLPFGSSYRTPRTRWWKGVISPVVVIGAMLVFSFVLSIVAVLVDMLLGMQDVAALTEGRISMTPSILAATNLSLVAAAGVALVAHRWINGVRFAHFHSVAPGLRWRWLLLSFAIVAPVYLLFAASSFLDPAYQTLTFSGTTVAFLCVIVLTTPLQAAAEEYMFRGVVQRSVGSWFRSHRWGLIVGTAVSATVFSAAHFAADIWLIVYYLLFGVLLSVLTQRTGGLESAIAIHTANNLFLLIVASLGDQMDAGFDRSAGVGGPIMLVPLAILALIVAGLSWFAKRRKLARTTGGGDAAGAATVGGATAIVSPATGPIPVTGAPTAAGAESVSVDPWSDPHAGPTAAGPGDISATTGPIPTDLGPAPPHSRGPGE